MREERIYRWGGKSEKKDIITEKKIREREESEVATTTKE